MIASVQAVADEVQKLQNAGKKVVFTNGCFDILHSGHIDMLRRSRALGDALVVAINSDASVGRMKGSNRPIIPQDERAEVLDGMEMIDFVCIFDEPTPLEAILQIRPHVLVKGADPRRDPVRPRTYTFSPPEQATVRHPAKGVQRMARSSLLTSHDDRQTTNFSPSVAELMLVVDRLANDDRALPCAPGADDQLMCLDRSRLLNK